MDIIQNSLAVLRSKFIAFGGVVEFCINRFVAERSRVRMKELKNEIDSESIELHAIYCKLKDIFAETSGTGP